MEFLTNTVNGAIPLVVATIVEHASYPFHVDKKITELVNATRNLAVLKEDVKTKIINAERQNGAPTKKIEDWLNKVGAIEKEAEEIPQNHHKRRWSIFSDYTTGRSVVKKLREIKSLCDERISIEETKLLPPPHAQEMPASSSKSANLESALDYIKDDVHDIIGLYGMGGVGKTHLLKQINNYLCKDSTINLVIFITCSKECSEEKIQDEIISRLDLTIKRNNSIEQKQSTIFNFLKDRGFVLLLDDLWSRIDLEIVGIPILLGLTSTCKRKIVLTTRSKDVCALVEVKKKIKVDVLNSDGAWNLFMEKATEETIVSHPLIQKFAVEVVKELGGLPLALITIGRAMRDKRDPSEWELAVELLKQARLNDVAGTDETVFKVLKFSYDKLKSDTLRECFLHCSLWPEDYEIEKDELVELWLGLGLIDEPHVNMAYNIGYSYICGLQAICLLEASDRESRVKLHDVIRDMSLWIIGNQGIEKKPSLISSKGKETGKNKWIIWSGLGLAEVVIPKETEKISIINHKDKLLSFSASYDSKLTTFLFSPSHLNDMKCLPIQLFSKLTVLNLRGNRFDIFPIEICSLRSLRFVDLSGNEIMSLPNKLGELTNLKYMFLRGNKIGTFPIGAISKIKALYIIDLTRRFGSYKKAYQSKLDFVPALLEQLQILPKFGAIGIEVNDMMQFRKLNESKVPVRWLTITIWEEIRTFSFSCWFLGASQSRSNLVSLHITNMEVEQLEFVKTCRKQCSCQLGRLEDLYIFAVRMKEIVWKGLDPKNVLQRLKRLTIYTCDNLMSISWVVYLPCLQELKVTRCWSMKQLIYGNEQSEPTFPFLKLLELLHLNVLESICDPKITFPALESLTILRCKKLKKLPFRKDTIPRKLICIRVNEEWWDDVKFDEDSVKASLTEHVSPCFN